MGYGRGRGEKKSCGSSSLRKGARVIAAALENAIVERLTDHPPDTLGGETLLLPIWSSAHPSRRATKTRWAAAVRVAMFSRRRGVTTGSIGGFAPFRMPKR